MNWDHAAARGHPAAWHAPGHYAPYAGYARPVRYAYSPAQPSGYQYTGSYTGFGIYDNGAARRPRANRTLRVALGAVGVFAILAGSTVTAISLSSTRNTAQAPSAPPPPPAPRQAPAPAHTTPPAPPPRVPGWQVAYNPDVRLAYDVPPNWRVAAPRERANARVNPDITLSGLAHGPGYDCAPAPRRNRGTVGSYAARGTGDLSRDAAIVADTYTREHYGGAAPQITAAPAQPVAAGGVHGMLVESTARMAQSRPCMPAEGKVYTLALQAKSSVVLLVVSADTVGGPPAPAAPSVEQVRRIVDSARPVTR